MTKTFKDYCNEPAYPIFKKGLAHIIQDSDIYCAYPGLTKLEAFAMAALKAGFVGKLTIHHAEITLRTLWERENKND